MKIVETNYGIANCIGNKYIEINRDLKKYPELYKEVLAHEKEHLESKGIFDFKIEFKNMLNFKKQFQLLMFSFKHPKSFRQMSPIYLTKKGWAIDSFLTSFYSIMLIGMLGVLIW